MEQVFASDFPQGCSGNFVQLIECVAAVTG